jgi:anaerobic nitric oxide reductase transcription regulator
MAERQTVTPTSSPDEFPMPHSSETLAAAMSEFQKSWLRDCLNEHGNNVAAAARAAGVDRSNFFRLLKEFESR